MPFLRVLFAFAVVFLLVPPGLRAEDEAPDPAPSHRATLKAPTPFDRISLTGDVAIGGAWAGRWSLEANAKKRGRLSVWRVQERMDLDHGGEITKVVGRWELSPDLSLRSGSYELEVRGSSVSLLFGPEPDGRVRITRTARPWHGTPSEETLHVEVPAGALFGHATLFLLARSLPAEGAEPLREPWLALDQIARRGKAALQEGGGAVETIVLRPQGPTKFSLGKGHAALGHAVAVSFDRTEDSNAGPQGSTLYVAPGGKALLGRKGPEGAWLWGPTGQFGTRPDLPEEKPATTWEQAMLKFGYGYHMARPELLEDAFAWEHFRAHEVEVTKGWDAARDVAAFREAWIESFIEGSVHRTRAATHQLLTQTLATGTARKEGADRIVFSAHPQFGGGVKRVYHFLRVDGIWRIARIESGP